MLFKRQRTWDILLKTRVVLRMNISLLFPHPFSSFAIFFVRLLIRWSICEHYCPFSPKRFLKRTYADKALIDSDYALKATRSNCLSLCKWFSRRKGPRGASGVDRSSSSKQPFHQRKRQSFLHVSVLLELIIYAKQKSRNVKQIKKNARRSRGFLCHLEGHDVREVALPIILHHFTVKEKLLIWLPTKIQVKPVLKSVCFCAWRAKQEGQGTRISREKVRSSRNRRRLRTWGLIRSEWG